MDHHQLLVDFMQIFQDNNGIEISLPMKRVPPLKENSVLPYSEGRVSISGQHEETLVVWAGGQIERIDPMDLGLPIAMTDDITLVVLKQQ